VCNRLPSGLSQATLSSILQLKGLAHRSSLSLRENWELTNLAFGISCTVVSRSPCNRGRIRGSIFTALSCIAALAFQWCHHWTSWANIKSHLGATAAAKKGVAAPLARDLWNAIFHMTRAALCQLKIFKFFITRQAKFMFLTQWTFWRASIAAMILPRGQTLLASAAFTNITGIAHKDTFLGLCVLQKIGESSLGEHETSCNRCMK